MVEHIESRVAAQFWIAKQRRRSRSTDQPGEVSMMTYGGMVPIPYGVGCIGGYWATYGLPGLLKPPALLGSYCMMRV